MDTLTELTPAEAMALLDPLGAKGQAMFKATVMALMLQGHVRAVTEDRSFTRTPTTRLHLRPGLLDTPGLPAHVRAAATLLHGPAGRLVSTVAIDARLAYGPHLERFRDEQVIPALIGHELLERQARRIMGLPLGHRLVHTPAGAAVHARLRALLDQARNVPRFWDSDPAQAAAIVAALGTLVLLVDELAPHLQRLSDALRPPPASDAGSGDGSGSSGDVGWGHGDRHRSTSGDGTSGQSVPEWDGPGQDGGLGAMNWDAGAGGFDGAGLGGVDFGSFDAGFDAAVGGSDTKESGGGWGSSDSSSGSGDSGSSTSDSGSSDSGSSSDSGGSSE